MSAAPELAGEPGRCCVPGCGVPSPRSLCPECFRTYAPGGMVPAWLRSIERLADKANKREIRNRERLARQAHPTHAQSGLPLAMGVSFQRIPDHW